MQSRLFLWPGFVVSVAACTPALPEPEVPVSLTSGSVESPSSAPTDRLDDAAIATIAVSIADGQVARAYEGERRSDDPRLRAIARDFVDDAPAPMIEQMSLAPRASVLDDEVTSATSGDLGYLSVKRGAEFDYAFLEAEERSLADAILLFDGTLIPTAVNVELAQGLHQARDELARELGEVTALRIVLEPAPPSTTPP